MSSTALERLLSVLMAYPAAAIPSPTEPPADLAEYAYTLAARLSDGALGTEFARLRLPDDPAAALQEAAAALLEAQGIWVMRRASGGSGDLAALEAEAERVFQRIRADVNFVCGSAELSGEVLKLAGLSDPDKRGAAFAQLAALIDNNAGEFLPTDGIDPAALAAEARQWSSDLLKAQANGVKNAAAAAAKDVRDRANHHLDQLIDRIRAAAAFKFAGDARKVRAFMSRD